MQGLESTILDGRPVGRTEKLGIEPATAQLELGLGLNLAIYLMKLYSIIYKAYNLSI